MLSIADSSLSARIVGPVTVTSTEATRFTVISTNSVVEGRSERGQLLCSLPCKICPVPEPRTATWRSSVTTMVSGSLEVRTRPLAVDSW